MKKSVKIAVLFAVACLVTACYNDKGNYDYQEIGEAVIKAIPGVTDNNNRFVCLENEEIKLEPVLEFKDGITFRPQRLRWSSCRPRESCTCK